MTGGPLMRPGAPPLVLASRSAARAALLRQAGLAFAVRVAAVDEGTIRQAARDAGARPEAAAVALADAKAARIGAAEPGALVIGADQILVCDKAWFGKPATMEDASRQLCALRGRTHELVTAVVCHRDGARLWRHVARPRLTMRRFGAGFLAAYLAAEGEALLGCVGAYRLEGAGLHLFTRVEGEFGAILGLPMLALLGFLRRCQVVMG